MVLLNPSSLILCVIYQHLTDFPCGDKGDDLFRRPILVWTVKHVKNLASFPDSARAVPREMFRRLLGVPAEPTCLRPSIILEPPVPLKVAEACDPLHTAA